MSQTDFGTINPATKTGSQLATDLNDWRDTIHSSHAGASRPSYAIGAMIWVKQVSASIWEIYLYDGDTDILIAAINPTTNAIIPATIAAGGTGAATQQAALNAIAGFTTNKYYLRGNGTNVAMSAIDVNDLPSYVFDGGYRNKLRNNGFDIWSRSTSGTTTSGSGYLYSADGWMIAATGASSTWARVTNTDTGAPVYGLRITGATSNTNVTVAQRIESYLAATLTGRVVTFRMDINNNTGGTITPTLTVDYATASDNFSSLTNIISAVSLQPIAVGNGTLAYTFNIGANAYKGIQVSVNFGNNFSTTGKTVTIKNSDFRATDGITTGLNSSPPAFENRDYPAEHLLNARYLPAFLATGATQEVGNGFYALTTDARITIPFFTPARIAPTGITVSNATHISINGDAAGSVSSAIAYGGSGINAGVIDVTIPSTSIVLGHGCHAIFNNSAAYLLFTGAEL